MKKSTKTTAKNPQRDLPRVRLDENNRSPLYYQIFLILRSKIDNGEYQEGALLPGEWELAETFNVSRITTVRALNELAACGLVVRERGRGTRVRFTGSGKVIRGPTEGTNPYAVQWTRTGGTVESFISSPGSKGASKARIAEFEYIAAPKDIAQQLRMTVGEDVQHVIQIWRFEDRPFSHVTTYIPGKLAKAWTKGDLAGTRLSELLERAGNPIHHIEEYVTAALADTVLSEQLEVSVGSPLIKIIRKAFDKDDRVIEYALALYPPDRFHYFVTLTPAPTHPTPSVSPRKKAST